MDLNKYTYIIYNILFYHQRVFIIIASCDFTIGTMQNFNIFCYLYFILNFKI